jgi:hypothetical protein
MVQGIEEECPHSVRMYRLYHAAFTVRRCDNANTVKFHSINWERILDNI